MDFSSASWPVRHLRIPIQLPTCTRPEHIGRLNSSHGQPGRTEVRRAHVAKHTPEQAENEARVMKNHIQVVAALHVALGALSVLGALVLFGCLALAGGIVISQGEQEAAGILGIVAVVLGGFLALLGLPGIIGGWALFTGRSWGRPLVLVLGILMLFNIPIGTAVGIYTLWVLLREPEPESLPPVVLSPKGS